MGKRERNPKAATSHRNEQEPEVPKIVHDISSDEEEGNEDLSLKIVEKALLRACQSQDVPIKAVKTQKKIKKKVKKKQLRETTTVEVVLVKADESADISKVNESVYISKANESADIGKDEENADISKGDESAEKDFAAKTDGLVLRKLLRGPRYFDPPDTGSGWGACYNCGEEGHTSVNCTSARRRRPCFICGSLEHHVKECMKGQDCYICQKGGHRAKDCPENYKRASKTSKICLKCGDSGHHDMFSCKNDYFTEDLKGIQCYICKSFGHLCCADFTDSSSIELSCYRCGQIGHGGLDCGRVRSEKTIVPLGICYVCQEAGHIAKNCPSSSKDHSLSRPEKSNARSSGKCHGCGEGGHIARDCPHSAKDCGESRSKTCFTCGKEGHIARECLRLNEVEKRNYESSTPTKKVSKERVKVKKAKSAVTSEGLKAQKRKKAEFEEDRSQTPYSLKKRGGWITEDPIDFTGGETQWNSPMTPTYNRRTVYTPGVNGHDPCLDDTRYGSTMSNRHGQPSYDHYPSNEPYRQYRHAPSNGSYHQYEHGPSNGRYCQVTPSSRPHHRYVDSPSDLPYLAYADHAHPHYSYGPSPSHHQSYPSNGSPNIFQQSYPTTRFHNSGGEGMQRIRHRNR